MSTFIVIYSGNAIAAIRLFDSKNKCMLIKIRLIIDNYRSTKHCLLQLKPGRAFDNDSLNQWWIQRDMIHIMKQSLDCLQNPQIQQQFPIHIAVLDSGIRPDHPIFNGVHVEYKVHDYVNEQGVDPGIDTNGHGTFVAGIICNLLKDVKHMIKLSIIKIMGKDLVLNFECLKKSYDFLETNNELQDVFLICQASGFPETPDLEYRLKDKVTDKRSLIGAGLNEGNWLPSNIAWPAREAVAVGSHDENGKVSGCSPQGPELWVLAPGEYDFGEHGKFKGTSFAAPWVTALLAHFHLQLPHRYPGNK